jgi:hypothetical protein
VTTRNPSDPATATLYGKIAVGFSTAPRITLKETETGTQGTRQHETEDQNEKDREGNMLEKEFISLRLFRAVHYN